MPRPIAFFDMDDTLVGANTAALYFAQQRRKGALSAGQVARIAVAFAGYRLNLRDMTALIVQGAASARGGSEAAMAQDCAELYEREVRPRILPRAVGQLRAHQAQGHAVAIITASTPYIAQLLAQELEIGDILCTRLAVDPAGLFTGELVGKPCFGSEKVECARAFAAAEGGSLAEAWFYSDSHSDLPLLAAVGHPQVVRPDLALRWVARRRGWPILAW